MLLVRDLILASCTDSDGTLTNRCECSSEMSFSLRSEIFAAANADLSLSDVERLLRKSRSQLKQIESVKIEPPEEIVAWKRERKELQSLIQCNLIKDRELTVRLKALKDAEPDGLFSRFVQVLTGRRQERDVHAIMERLTALRALRHSYSNQLSELETKISRSEEEWLKNNARRIEAHARMRDEMRDRVANLARIRKGMVDGTIPSKYENDLPKVSPAAMYPVVSAPASTYR